jgi:hypothetical protein
MEWLQVYCWDRTLSAGTQEEVPWVWQLLPQLMFLLYFIYHFFILIENSVIKLLLFLELYMHHIRFVIASLFYKSQEDIL